MVAVFFGTHFFARPSSSTSLKKLHLQLLGPFSLVAQGSAASESLFFRNRQSDCFSDWGGAGVEESECADSV